MDTTSDTANVSPPIAPTTAPNTGSSSLQSRSVDQLPHTPLRPPLAKSKSSSKGSRSGGFSRALSFTLTQKKQPSTDHKSEEGLGGDSEPTNLNRDSSRSLVNQQLSRRTSLTLHYGDLDAEMHSKENFDFDELQNESFEYGSNAGDDSNSSVTGGNSRRGSELEPCAAEAERAVATAAAAAATSPAPSIAMLALQEEKTDEDDDNNDENKGSSNSNNNSSNNIGNVSTQQLPHQQQQQQKKKLMSARAKADSYDSTDTSPPLLPHGVSSLAALPRPALSKQASALRVGGGSPHIFPLAQVSPVVHIPTDLSFADCSDMEHLCNGSNSCIFTGYTSHKQALVNISERLLSTSPTQQQQQRGSTQSMSISADDQPLEDTFTEDLGDSSFSNKKQQQQQQQQQQSSASTTASVKESASAKKGRLMMAGRRAMEGGVIVKAIRKEHLNNSVAVREFLFERDVLAAMCHPRIISIYGAGADNSNPQLPSRPFLLVERLDGGCLSSLLSKPRGFMGSKPIPFPLAVQYGRDLAAAFKYLHHDFHPEAVIIHRDLKPDNICFTEHMELKLMDFGLCTCVRRSMMAGDGYKMTGNTGSMRYMAPEVVQCKAYNQSVDVYSFSIVFWQMLCCSTPFVGYNREQFKEKVVKQGFRPSLKLLDSGGFPNAAVELSELLSKCWSAVPAERLTMREVHQQLQQLHERVLIAPKRSFLGCF